MTHKQTAIFGSLVINFGHPDTKILGQTQKVWGVANSDGQMLGKIWCGPAKDFVVWRAGVEVKRTRQGPTTRFIPDHRRLQNRYQSS